MLVVATFLAAPLSATGADADWVRQFGTSGLDEVKGVAVDPDGNAYVAGETSGTLPGQTSAGTLDAFVAKFDPAGNEVWTRQFGTAERAIAWGLAIDPGGFAYVVGQVEDSLPGQRSAGGWDAFVRKYDLSGREIWTRQFGGAGSDVASGVAVNRAGNVSVVGTTSSTLPGQHNAGSFDAFIRRYDADGNEVWTRQFGTPGGDNARRVAFDGAGQILVVGSTEGTLPGQVSAGGYDAFVALFDQAGRQLWTRQFGSAGDDFGLAIAVDPSDNITVAGSADDALPGQTSPGGTTAFLRHLDSAGATLWTDQFGTGLADDAWDVTLDHAGNTWMVGTTERALPGQRSAGRIDAFVRTYDPHGKELWTHQYGTPQDDYALAVANDRQGIVIAGSTRGTLAGRSAGDLDAYLQRIPGWQPH